MDIPAMVDTTNVGRAPVRGWLLWLMRGAWWGLGLYSLGLFVPGIPHMRALMSIKNAAYIEAGVQLGLPPAFLIYAPIALQVLVVAVFTLGAAVIFWSKSDDWLAWLVSVALLTFAPTILPYGDEAILTAYPDLGLALRLLQGIGVGTLVIVFYLFPDGQFVPRWTRALALILPIWLFAYLFFPYNLPDPATWSDWLQVLVALLWFIRPEALVSLYGSLRVAGFGLMLAGWFLSTMGAQIYRYQRVATPLQRQQTKWVVVGVSVAALGGAVWLVSAAFLTQASSSLQLMFDLAAGWLSSLTLLLIPITLALSILHYRLWDVDVLINRTLVYGAVTTLLSAAYFVAIVWSLWLARFIMPARSPVSVLDVALIAISTLVITALFRPLRGRLQDFVDRRFYREKVDFREAFTEFSREIRAIIDLQELVPGLLSRLTKLLHIAHGAVFLSPAGGEGTEFELAGALNLPETQSAQLPQARPQLHRLQSGLPVINPRDCVFPLLVPLMAPKAGGNQLIGVLALGPRLSGLEYTREDQALITGLSDQVGVAIYVARLFEEWQAEEKRRVTVEQRLEAHRNSPLGRAEALAEQLVAQPGQAITVMYGLTQEAGRDAQAASLIGNLPKVLDNLNVSRLARTAEAFNYIYTSRTLPEMLPVGLRLLAEQLEHLTDLPGATAALQLCRSALKALDAAALAQIAEWAFAAPDAELPPVALDLGRFLADLMPVVQAVRAYERVDTAQDKLTYLARAVELLGRMERDARMQLGAADRPVIQRIVENWLAIITGVMSELQTRAQLVCELLTHHTWQGDLITVALNVRNAGRGAALNLKVNLVASPDYTLLDEDAVIERLAPGEEAQVELRVRPPAALQRFRARFVILYTDPRGPQQVEHFADVVQLMEATAQYRFIPNPYVVGTPLQTGSPLFVGRADVVAFIRDNLAAAHRNNLVLIGQRRTGKSSLLKQLPARLGEAYVPVYLDGQALGLDPGLPNFFLTLATEIAFALEDRGFAVQPPEAGELAHSPAAVFERQFLGRVRAAIGDRHLLLLLDEFEELEAAVRRGNLDASIFSFLRHLVQHSENLSVIFCGTHRLEELATDYWNVLFNISLYRHIGFLDQPEALRLIQEPVAEYGLRYDDLALDKMWRVTAGHPYFLQLLCHSLVNRHNQTQRSYVTVADVNAALDDILASGEAHFMFLWSESSPLERLVLTALSRSLPLSGQTTGVQVVDYLADRGVAVNRAEVAEALRRLTLRDILRAAENEPAAEETYRWRLGLVGLWAERYKSFNQVVNEAQGATRGG